MYRYLRIVRIIFMIGEKGKIEGIFTGPEGIEKVKTNEHTDHFVKFWDLRL